MSVIDCSFRRLVQVTDSISLTSPDGQEVTITTKKIEGHDVVSLFVDDGFNVSSIEIPRFTFDQLIFHLKPLH